MKKIKVCCFLALVFLMYNLSGCSSKQTSTEKEPEQVKSLVPACEASPYVAIPFATSSPDSIKLIKEKNIEKLQILNRKKHTDENFKDFLSFDMKNNYKNDITNILFAVGIGEKDGNKKIYIKSGETKKITLPYDGWRSIHILKIRFNTGEAVSVDIYVHD